MDTQVRMVYGVLKRIFDNDMSIYYRSHLDFYAACLHSLFAGVIGSRPSADMYSQIDIQRTEALRRAQASRGAQRTRLNR